MPAFQPGLDDAPWAAVRLADGYWRLQKVGAGLMVTGTVVFVLAWWVARRAARADGAGTGRLHAVPEGSSDGGGGEDGR